MTKSKRNLKLCAIGGIAAGFLNGLFGSGGGTLIVPFSEKFLKLDPQKSHATAIFIISGFTVVSLIFYAFSSGLDYKNAMYVSTGGVFGGYIGAKLLAKLSFSAIHKIFGSFMILAAVRMVFFS